jgi:tyrosyl-tRNA synthetase
MYGRTMRIHDEQIAPWFSLLLGGEPPDGLGPRDAKRSLARALVRRYHSEAASLDAEAAFDRLFIAHELPEAIEEVAIEAAGGPVHLPAVIADAFGRTRSDARRAIAQGGVKLDGEPLQPDVLDLPAEALDGRVLQVGKRQFRRVRVTGL